jgi:hypothetical protein
MRGPKLRQAPGRDLTPRRLPSGRYLGCRHLVYGKSFGFNADKAEQAHDVGAGFVTHKHDN